MKKAAVGVTLSGLLAVTLLACAHSPQKPAHKAEPVKAETEEEKEAEDDRAKDMEDLLASGALGDAPVENAFGDGGEGGELVVGRGGGGMAAMGPGKAGVLPKVVWPDVALSGKGSLAQDVVYDALTGIDGMGDCQTMYFADGSQKAVEIEVELTIQPDGQPINAVILNEDLPVKIQGCILNQLMSTRFAQPSGGSVTVFAVMAFEP